MDIYGYTRILTILSGLVKSIGCMVGFIGFFSMLVGDESILSRLGVCLNKFILNTNR
jgi:hypothetical protein